MVSQHDFDWLVVVDDDAYVNVAGMRKVLELQTGGRTMLGILGCGGPTCRNGFCGGGGYILSKEAAQELVAEKNPGGFFEEFMDVCKRECTQNEDIAVAQLGRRRGMEPQRLGGLHGWRLKPEDKAEVQGCHREPLTFHYLRSQEDFQNIGEYLSSAAARCNWSAVLPHAVGSASSVLELPQTGAMRRSSAESQGRTIWMWSG